MQLRSDLKTVAVDRPDEKPLHLITECVQKNNAQINEKECNRLRGVLNYCRMMEGSKLKIYTKIQDRINGAPARNNGYR